MCKHVRTRLSIEQIVKILWPFWWRFMHYFILKIEYLKHFPSNLKTMRTFMEICFLWVQMHKNELFDEHSRKL